MKIRSSFKKYAMGFNLAILFSTILVLTGCQGTPEEQFAKAVNYSQQGNLIDAKAICENILQNTEPGDPIAQDVKLLLAECERAIGDMDRARELWNEVVVEFGWQKNEKGHSAFRSILTSYIMEAKELDNEKAYLEGRIKALKLVEEKNSELKEGDPLKIEFKFATAMIHTETNNTTESARLYQLMVFDENTSESARQSALKLASQVLTTKLKDFTGSIEMHEKYLEMFPDTKLKTNLYQQLNQLYDHIKDEENAEKYRDLTFKEFDSQLAKTPGADNKIFILAQKASVLRINKQFDEAHKIYKDIIERYPNSRLIVQVQSAVCETYYQSGDLDSAIAGYEKIAEENKGSDIGRKAGAWVLQLRDVKTRQLMVEEQNTSGTLKDDKKEQE